MIFKKSDKVEHEKFGVGRVQEEMGKGAHGERVLVKFDKGGEKVMLTSHLVNHSENERTRREREREEISKIKKRKMVIDSSQLDGLDTEEIDSVADAPEEEGEGSEPEEKEGEKTKRGKKGEKKGK